MNPFTRFLSQWSQDRDLAALIARWDVVEALAVRVYKARQATAEDEAAYQAARDFLQIHYPAWAERLRPYWQQALVGGRPAQSDPFYRLLAAERAQDFVGDWEALQHLPAAREALNQLLVAGG